MLNGADASEWFVCSALYDSPLIEGVFHAMQPHRALRGDKSWSWSVRRPTEIVGAQISVATLKVSPSLILLGRPL